jgi:Family of unknown function (DUF5360)
MSPLKYFFLLIDLGFIAYLYNDYTNPVLVNWNWSFFPLDMFVSGTGLFSLYLFRKGNQKWRVSALISLILTSVSGLQAISYWVLAHDYDPTWWIPNLFLLIYPVFFIPKLVRSL